VIGEIFKGKNSQTNFTVTDIGHGLKFVEDERGIRAVTGGGYLIVEQILLQLFRDRFRSKL